MEEKERYEWNSRFDEAIKDNQTGDIVNAVEILNKQDKRIKELEETNKVLSNELTKNSILKQDHIETCCGIPIFEIPKIKEENQQLKQQLHDLPKKIVGEIKEWIKSQIIYCGGKADEVDILIANASNQVLEDLQNILDTILKKYGGEENEKLRNVQND